MWNRGIDVSDHNGHLDWEELKRQGLEFAIIRLGWGNDDKSQDDREYQYNLSECQRLGIPFGVYLYSYAISEEDLLSEINHTLRLIEGIDISLGVWFDMEDSDGYKDYHGFNPYEHGEELTRYCREFIDFFKTEGYKSGVYSNPDYFINVLDKSQFVSNEIWLAHWGVDEPYCDCLMWQHSSDGHFDSFNCRFDSNIYFGETEETEETEEKETIDSDITFDYNVGDKVIILTDSDGNFYDTNGTLCHSWHDEYSVIDSNDDGVCVGVDGVVTARIPYNIVKGV